MTCEDCDGQDCALARATGQEVQVEQLSSSKDGYDTYRVAVGFDPETTEDVYALYGEEGDPLIIPPAFQVAAPFGSDMGPVSLRSCAFPRTSLSANA